MSEATTEQVEKAEAKAVADKAKADAKMIAAQEKDAADKAEATAKAVAKDAADKAKAEAAKIVDKVARKTANEAAKMIRKVITRLEALIGFDIDGDGIVGKGGHSRLPILIVLLGVCVFAFGANELVWKVGDSAYVDAEGDATFNSVTSGDLTTTTTAVSGNFNIGTNATVGGTLVVTGNVAGAIGDFDSLTVNAASGLDSKTAGALPVGAATATSLLLGASDIETSILGGLNLKYANKTGNYTNSATDVILSYATAAATTNTLPEASTVLGSVFVICLQADTGDLVVKTDATDKFDGTNNQITFADAGDSCWLMATAANVYTILVNVGGTLGTQ